LLTTTNQASKVILASLKIRLPSTTTVYKTGVETSNKMFYPAGIYTVSPSLGGASPPHVKGELHKSI